MQELRPVWGCFSLRRSLSRLRAQVSKVSKVFRPGCCGRGFWAPLVRAVALAGGWLCVFLGLRRGRYGLVRFITSRRLVILALREG